MDQRAQGRKGKTSAHHDNVLPFQVFKRPGVSQGAPDTDTGAHIQIMKRRGDHARDQRPGPLNGEFDIAGFGR